ncbi:prepilin peptidase [Marisediminicola sp. LYQ134]|uniref:prepilin peptidase n=1 Tax=Marisediminicola sp. LYQ134 TaxID=3391061 RepID=UPI003983C2D4
MLAAYLLVVIGLLGLAIGSFLNVVIWRVPRGESLSRPPSACPRCGHRIRWHDNIPVLGWVLLRGRCRDCGEPISVRYPVVEAATGVLFVLVALRFGLETPGVLALPAYLYFAAVSVALALIDLDTRRLPNVIVLPSWVVGVVLLGGASALAGEWDALIRSLIGAAALFVFYLVLALAVPRGMGLGDVKLAFVIGLHLAWIGWDALAVGAFGAFLLGGLFSLGLLASGRAGRKSGIPFGPWMILGAFLGIFFGRPLASGYLALVGLA